MPLIPEQFDRLVTDDDHAQLARRIQSLWKEAKEYREPDEKNWEIAEQYMAGIQWKNVKPPKVAFFGQTADEYKVTYPLLRPTIRSAVSNWTDSMPTIRAEPGNEEEPEDRMGAETVTALFDWAGRKVKLPLAYQDMCMSAGIRGQGCWKTGWGTDDKPRLTYFPSYELFPAPGATDLQNAPFVIHAVMRDVFQLRAQYPKFASHIRPLYAGQHGGDETGAGEQHWGFTSGADTYYIEGKGEAGDDDRLKYWNKALVWEMWLREPEREGQWPYGRVITATGNVVLDDQPNPFFDYENKVGHGKFPFVILKAGRRDNSFWGESLCVGLKCVQDEINYLLTQIKIRRNVAALGVIVADTDAIENPNADPITPGSVIYVKPNSRFDLLNTSTADPNDIALLQEYKRLLDEVSGLHEVTRGEKPGMVTSGIAIETLRHSAMAIIRMHQRQATSTFEELGAQFLGNSRQFMSPEQIQEVAGTPTPPPGQEEAEPIPAFIPDDVDLIIESGVRGEKEIEAQKFMALAEMQKVDTQTLLEKVTDPGEAKVILQRMAEEAEQAKKAQQEMMLFEQSLQPIGGGSSSRGSSSK